MGFKKNNLKIDPKEIKQKISERMTDDLIEKISYKN
tara:strand:+ start:135 stop:242 length:108 start_codon:yes stop_codon:yes gene_type:complete